jgi:hypothetical protein
MRGGGHGLSVEEFSKMLERGAFTNGDIITVVSKNNKPVFSYCSGYGGTWDTIENFKWMGVIINNNQLVELDLRSNAGYISTIRDERHFISDKKRLIDYLTEDVEYEYPTHNRRKIFVSYDTTERPSPFRNVLISKWFHVRSGGTDRFHDHTYYDATNLIVLGAEKYYDDFAMISHNATRKVNAERNPTLSRVFSEHGMVNHIASFLPHKSGTVIDHEKARQKQLERWSKQRQYFDTMIDSVSNDLHRVTLSKKEEEPKMKKNRTRRSRSI